MNLDLTNPLVTQYETINPYRLGVGYIIRRLQWDLSYYSWISRHRLKHYKNKFSGEKAVILCNGPSLNQTDFALLDNIYTFGLNKINLLFNKNNFRPDFIVSVNKHVIEQNKSFFNQTNIPLFLDSKSKINIKLRKNICFIPGTQHRLFSKDCSMNVYSGFTVTFVALQLAFHMGFNEVTLIGCDHNFQTKGVANKEVRAEEEDPNHFDPNYFSNGVKWELPDLFESEISYMMAKKMFEAHNRKLFNSTIGGKLEIFDRINLADFINQ